jgi:predicted signal transduction protein with EAL and GGDEF domain
LRGWLARTLQSAAAMPRAEPGPFRALFEASTEGLLVCAADGKVLAANAAACRLLAVKARALVGRPVADVLGQDDGAGAAPGALRDGEALTRGASGSQRLISVRLTPLANSGRRQSIVHLHDRGEQLQTQARLTQLANYDSLTGLPNRALFRDRLSMAMSRAQRTGVPIALMFLDLDRFKVINDSLGHEVGDRLLKHVARTLTHCLRNVDSVAHAGGEPFVVSRLGGEESSVIVEEPFVLSRLGGDEFTVIVEAIGTAEDAAVVARRLLDAVNAPFVVGEEEIVVSASIGISMYPTDDVDLDGLIRHTDMAMYRSKSLGRGTYSFFSDDLNAAVSSRVSLEGSLRRAIERNEFQLFFQPKAELRSGGITGVEALVRWHRPGHGIVPPDRFISVLEDTGMILPVGAWVIRAACQQLAAWDRMGLPPMRLAVNLSARQFRHLYLASLVEDSLRENSLDPKRLEIELTESLLMEDTETNRAMMENFRRMGVRLAIDDFGTGHSSLSYIKRFNVDTLKIDRTFVHSLPDSADDMAIVAAVVAMGRSMHMCVVAEGVETIEQAEVLRELGCDEMQGYLLARAMPGADFAAWLLDYKRSRSRRRSRNHFSDTTPITQFTLLDA